MSPLLEALPIELVEEITRQSDKSDVFSLRLVSRSLNEKIIQGRFKEIFTIRRLDLINTHLERFIEVTKPSSLGCLLEDLTITGPVYNTKTLEAMVRKGTQTVTESNGPMFMSKEVPLKEDEMSNAKSDLEVLRGLEVNQNNENQSGAQLKLLTTALRNLHHHGSKGKLRSITLNVVVYCNPQERLEPKASRHWTEVWEMTAHTLSTTLQALLQSGLHFESLDAFSSTMRCSVAANEFSAMIQETKRSPAFNQMKRLAISISDRLIEADCMDFMMRGGHLSRARGDSRALLGDPGSWAEMQDIPLDKVIAFATEETNFTGCADLLAQTPALEELDLHCYSLCCYKLSQSMVDVPEERLFKNIAMTVSLPLLRKCALRGVKITEESAVEFLKRSPLLEQLELDNITMKTGTWRPVFDYISAQDCRLSYLKLGDLWESRRLYFDDPGTPTFPTICGTTGPNMIIRDGRSEVQRRIGYHFARGRQLGSPQAYNWRARRQANYGPP